MTNDADLGKCLAAAQVCQTGGGIAGKVLTRGVPHVAPLGGSRGTVVVAQRGDAVAGQVVGNDEERLVVEDFLVAVLLTAAGDEEGDDGFLLRLRIIPDGQHQRAGQRGTVPLVAERHLLGLIREWRLRGLRASQLFRALCQH